MLAVIEHRGDEIKNKRGMNAMTIAVTGFEKIAEPGSQLILPGDDMTCNGRLSDHAFVSRLSRKNNKYATINPH
jgi:hypothetical protein